MTEEEPEVPLSYSEEMAMERKGRFRKAWKESHGNWILGFTTVLLAIGLLVMWAQPSQPELGDLDLIANNGGSATSAVVEPQLPLGVLLVRVTTSQADKKGPIRIAIYDSKDTFGKIEEATIKDSLVPIEGFVTWEIQLDFLPESFSIAAYHDLDDNSELNRGLFNAPIEPYGFSNNARSLVGPPTFEETVVQRPATTEILQIRVY